jgi:hypothetical protein
LQPDSTKLASVDGHYINDMESDGNCLVWDLINNGILWRVTVGSPIWSVAWGVDWALGRERVVAGMMGRHERLGTESPFHLLDDGVLRMVVDPL